MERPSGLPRPRGASFLLYALLLAVVAVGCAGAPSIPKDVYLARGNQVCQQAAENSDELVKEMPKDSVAERETYVKRKLGPALQNVLSQLQQLGAPAGDAEYLNSIFKDAAHAVSVMVDQPSTDLEAHLEQPFAKPAARFEAYGLKDCAKI